MALNLPRTFNLSGRTALVTGAGGLLGPQHGIALAETGASIILADIDAAKVESAVGTIREEVPGAQVQSVMLDVRDAAAIRELAKTLADREVKIEILINNAAIDAKVTAQPGVGNGSRLEFFTIEQWDREIAVGLTGALLCSQVFGTAMARSGGGVILNIASDLSVFAPDQRIYRRDDISDEMDQPVKPVTYSAIKHALIGLTKYLATYWADAGVRANALSPGGVSNGQSKDFVQKLTQLIPMGRMAELDEYRGAIQFLCSDASAYMTGQNIVMDGGRSVL